MTISQVHPLEQAINPTAPGALISTRQLNAMGISDLAALSGEKPNYKLTKEEHVARAQRAQMRALVSGVLPQPSFDIEQALSVTPLIEEGARTIVTIEDNATDNPIRPIPPITPETLTNTTSPEPTSVSTDHKPLPPRTLDTLKILEVTDEEQSLLTNMYEKLKDYYRADSDDREETNKAAAVAVNAARRAMDARSAGTLNPDGKVNPGAGNAIIVAYINKAIEDWLRERKEAAAKSQSGTISQAKPVERTEEPERLQETDREKDIRRAGALVQAQLAQAIKDGRVREGTAEETEFIIQYAYNIVDEMLADGEDARAFIGTPMHKAWSRYLGLALRQRYLGVKDKSERKALVVADWQAEAKALNRYIRVRSARPVRVVRGIGRAVKNWQAGGKGQA